MSSRTTIPLPGWRAILLFAGLTLTCLVGWKSWTAPPVEPGLIGTWRESQSPDNPGDRNAATTYELLPSGRCEIDYSTWLSGIPAYSESYYWEVSGDHFVITTTSVFNIGDGGWSTWPSSLRYWVANPQCWSRYALYETTSRRYWILQRTPDRLTLQRDPEPNERESSPDQIQYLHRVEW